MLRNLLPFVQFKKFLQLYKWYQIAQRTTYVRNTAVAVDVGVQFDSAVVRQRIRKVRDCANKIKSACAKVSVKCNISTQASCIAVQTISNTLYGHKYYLTKDEAIQNDPSLKKYMD